LGDLERTERRLGGDYDFYGDPAAWGEFVRATTSAIRSTKVGRKDTVVAGPFALDVPGWEAFVDQSYTSQAISVHTYANPGTAVARINAADARTDKPIWITEISWPEDGSGNQARNTRSVLDGTPGKPYFHFTLHEFDGVYWPKELAATPATLDLLQLAAAGGI
jgi:Glycosyl hydrolase catalytic core